MGTRRRPLSDRRRRYGDPRIPGGRDIDALFPRRRDKEDILIILLRKSLSLDGKGLGEGESVLITPPLSPPIKGGDKHVRKG